MNFTNNMKVIQIIQCDRRVQQFCMIDESGIKFQSFGTANRHNFRPKVKVLAIGRFKLSFPMRSCLLFKSDLLFNAHWYIFNKPEPFCTRYLLCTQRFWTFLKPSTFQIFYVLLPGFTMPHLVKLVQYIVHATSAKLRNRR